MPRSGQMTGGRYQRVAIDDGTLAVRVFSADRGDWVAVERPLGWDRRAGPARRPDRAGRIRDRRTAAAGHPRRPVRGLRRCPGKELVRPPAPARRRPADRLPQCVEPVRRRRRSGRRCWPARRPSMEPADRPERRSPRTPGGPELGRRRLRWRDRRAPRTALRDRHRHPVRRCRPDPGPGRGPGRGRAPGLGDRLGPDRRAVRRHRDHGPLPRPGDRPDGGRGADQRRPRGGHPGRPGDRPPGARPARRAWPGWPVPWPPSSSSHGRTAAAAGATSGWACWRASGSACFNIAVSRFSPGQVFAPLTIVRASEGLLVVLAVLVVRRSWRLARPHTAPGASPSARWTWAATPSTSWRPRPAASTWPRSCRRSTR